MPSQKKILEVKNLKKYFPAAQKQQLKAVDNVSFDIYEGETLGIVGESGCGKTTCGKTCLGMYPVTDGEILFHGKNIHTMSKKERFAFTKRVQMIFQDPYASLDPHQKVYDIIAEGIQIHGMAKNKTEEKKMVAELLEMVGLNAEHASRNVHEFSGGQRQRIGIARALSVNPEFLFCDEPISALDVSIQAQIINLLMKLQKEKNLTMLFIAHDLSIVKHISDRIGVMYLGKMVELTESSKLYVDPKHPYTRALLDSVPKIHSINKETLYSLKGTPPDLINPPVGCSFAPRCEYGMNICRKKYPELTKFSDTQECNCWLHDPRADVSNLPENMIRGRQ